MAGERHVSDDNSHHFTIQNPMHNPNGFDMHRDLHQMPQYAPNSSFASSQMFVNEESYSHDGQKMKKAILGRASEKGSDRATPMIGQTGGKRREIQIRKNRNLRQLRPPELGLGNTGNDKKTFDSMLRID